MYKPRTIEQFKIMEYIKDNFHMECLLVAPVSRSSLMIQDEIGDRMAFQWMDGHVLEAPLPTPASNQEHLAFIKAFWADPRHPQFMSFDDLTTWWLNNPTPLTHQQILNLPDDLYCRYLECEQLLELDDVLTLAGTGWGLLVWTAMETGMTWCSIMVHRLRCGITSMLKTAKTESEHGKSVVCLAEYYI